MAMAGLGAADDDRHALLSDGLPRDGLARKIGELPLHLLAHALGHLLANRHENGHGQRVVLRLREQIGGHPRGIGCRICSDDDLGGSGDHLDTHVAEHQSLGRGHVGVARAHDLVDAGNALRAVGQGSDGLRPANKKDPVDASLAARQPRFRAKARAWS
jgi:hypothetical protein